MKVRALTNEEQAHVEQFSLRGLPANVALRRTALRQIEDRLREQLANATDPHTKACLRQELTRVRQAQTPAAAINAMLAEVAALDGTAQHEVRELTEYLRRAVMRASYTTLDLAKTLQRRALTAARLARVGVRVPPPAIAPMDHTSGDLGLRALASMLIDHELLNARETLAARAANEEEESE